MKFQAGDEVKKITGDYTFTGVVVAAFYKLKRHGDRNAERFVVENDAGILHIFSGPQLARAGAVDVVINGVKHRATTRVLTYRDVLSMAFMHPPWDRLFTVTFIHPHGHDLAVNFGQLIPEGNGEPVVDGTSFTVTDTSKA